MPKLRILDWIVVLFISFICGFIFISIFNLVIKNNIKLFSVESPLIFPLLVGVTMSICLLFTIYKENRNIKEAEENKNESSKELYYEIIVAVIFLVIILAYTLLLKNMGFILGSVVFMVFGMMVLNYDDKSLWKKLYKASAISLITVPTLYYVFHEIFNVMLP